MRGTLDIQGILGRPHHRAQNSQLISQQLQLPLQICLIHTPPPRIPVIRSKPAQPEYNNCKQYSK